MIKSVFKRLTDQPKFRMPLGKFMIVFLVILSTIPLSVIADDGISDLSLYYVSSAIVAGFDSVLAESFRDSEDNRNEAYEAFIAANIPAGNAGIFLAHPAPAELISSTSWGGRLVRFVFGSDTVDSANTLTSSLSRNSVTWSHQTLLSLASREDGEWVGSGIADFAIYGFALNEINLVQTAPPTGFNIVRGFFGWLLDVFYTISFVVPLLFGAIISLLQALNPFRLFIGLFTNMDSTGITGLTNMAPGDIFYPVAVIVTALYNGLRSIGLLLILPVTLLTTLISIYMFKERNGISRFGRIWKWFLRAIVISVGIPLLGLGYTTMLDSLDNMITGHNAPATRIVNSVLFDFSAWATNQRLSPPMRGDEALIRVAGTPDSATGLTYVGAPATDIAFMINTWNNGGLASIVTEGTGWDTDTESDLMTDSGRTAMMRTRNMIQRYRSGAFFEASDFESIVNRQLITAANNNSNVGTRIGGWFGVNDSFEINGFDLLEPAATVGERTIFNNGGLIAVTTGTHNNTLREFRETSTSTSMIRSSQTLGVFSDGGLSSVSMYNFLNLEFTESNVTAYSPVESASPFVRNRIYAVSNVGAGVEGLFNLVNASSQLAVLTIVGILYVFSILFSGLRRQWAMIKDLIPMMFGSIKAFIRILSSMVSIIVMIVGTLFFYALFAEMMLAVYDTSLRLLMGAIQLFTGFDSEHAMWISVLLLIRPKVSTVLMIMFAIVAVRERRKFVMSIEEVMSGLLERLMDNVRNPEGSHAMSQEMESDDSGNLGRRGVKTAGKVGGALVGGAATVRAVDSIGNMINKASKEGDDDPDQPDPDGGGTKGSNGGSDGHANDVLDVTEEANGSGFNSEADVRCAADDFAKEPHSTRHANQTDETAIGTKKADKDGAGAAQHEERVHEQKRKEKAVIDGEGKAVAGAAEIGAGVATGNASFMISGASKINESVSDKQNAEAVAEEKVNQGVDHYAGSASKEAADSTGRKVTGTVKGKMTVSGAGTADGSQTTRSSSQDQQAAPTKPIIE